MGFYSDRDSIARLRSCTVFFFFGTIFLRTFVYTMSGASASEGVFQSHNSSAELRRLLSDIIHPLIIQVIHVHVNTFFSRILTER